MNPEQLIEEIMDAQADLQMGLGIVRLEISQIANKDGIAYRNLDLAEDRLTESLARLHLLLEQLGHPMYDPATHPHVKDSND